MFFFHSFPNPDILPDAPPPINNFFSLIVILSFLVRESAELFSHDLSKLVDSHCLKATRSLINLMFNGGPEFMRDVSDVHMLTRKLLVEEFATGCHE